MSSRIHPEERGACRNAVVETSIYELWERWRTFVVVVVLAQLAGQEDGEQKSTSDLTGRTEEKEKERERKNGRTETREAEKPECQKGEAAKATNACYYHLRDCGLLSLLMVVVHCSPKRQSTKAPPKDVYVHDNV